MQRIVLDTDIGTDVDDALALALAAASADLSLEAVTTVHGDAPLRARLARQLLELAGRPEVPVIAGASQPLGAPTAHPFHWPAALWGHEGEGVLAPDELAPTADPQATAHEAVEAIVSTVAAQPGAITLVAVGPLTNIALALKKEPRLAAWARGLTLMGGMVDAERSVWPPVLETNLNADPAAAEHVFASGIPLTVVPIEVTTQVFLTPADRARMASWGHPLSEALLALIEVMRDAFRGFSERMNLPNPDIFQGRTFMHDPLAIAVAAGLPFLTLQPMHLRLETIDGVLRTMPFPGQPANSQVCTAVDARALVECWLERVHALTLA